MKKRELGNTGLKVSEIGFGSWQLGNTQRWKGATGEKAIKLVDKGIDMGCNFFDTAPVYAGGNSEKLLGKALKGKRDQVIISTKFGNFPDGTTDYSASLLRKSIQDSLERLQTDYVDTLLLHGPPMEDLRGEGDHFAILNELKKEGLIKSYGASVDTSEEMIALMESTDSQVIEIMFNILYQEPKKAFDMAADKGVGLIVKVPLDSGWLTGKYDENSSFNGVRERWSEEVIKRRAKLVDKIKDIKKEESSMVEEALRFILAYPEISTVIPGIRNNQQLEENLNAGQKQMSSQQVKKYEKLYEENIKDNPLPW